VLAISAPAARTLQWTCPSSLRCTASEAYVGEFSDRASAAASRLTADYEIIFVNDGSPDESLDRTLELYREDPRVRIVDLSRNFGHHRAILSGLQYASGDLVFLIDSDLEEDPCRSPKQCRVLGGVRHAGGLRRQRGSCVHIAFEVGRHLPLGASMTRRETAGSPSVIGRRWAGRTAREDAGAYAARRS
jgi:glycosyltransferase involved in cell wall biosynthesis